MTDWPMHESRRSSRDRWIPWTFVAFFLVIFAVNGIMLTFALRSFNGLSTDGAYNRGLAYNETLASHQAQYTMGWQVDLTVEEAAQKRSIVTFTAFDADGLPLPIDDIKAVARRPISEISDFDVDFRQTGRGLFEAGIDWPLEGQWELRLIIASRNQSYRLDRRIFVR